MNDLKRAFRQLLKNPDFTVHPPQCRLPERLKSLQCWSESQGHARSCRYGGRAVAVLTVSVILFLVALLASFLPARRAALVDPMEALRHE